MGDEILVFYVTATHDGAATDERTGQPARTEVGKFFSRADAEAFKRGLHNTWRRPEVVERREPRGKQDPAHRRVGL